MTVVVKLHEKPEGPPPPTLEKLTGLTAADMAGVNEVILQQMQSPVILIPQVAGHIVESGGKRLRPMLTLSAARRARHNAAAPTPAPGSKTRAPGSAGTAAASNTESMAAR